jgi:hypothetical protein
MIDYSRMTSQEYNNSLIERGLCPLCYRILAKHPEPYRPHHSRDNRYCCGLRETNDEKNTWDNVFGRLTL